MKRVCQRTIGREASFDGIGLHTGERGRVTFRPAPEDSGLRFVRTDLPGTPGVQVRPEHARFDPNAGRRTILEQDGVQIHTMEHLLAAVGGLGIDNLIIETTTMEIPEPSDGSAAPIAKVLLDAGIVNQERAPRHIKISKPVHWSSNGAEISAVPFNGLRLSYRIEYPNPLIGTQVLTVDIDPDTFLRDIAPARTFVLERDLESLRSAGWIKGGRIESAVVVGDSSIRNDEPLRFDNEFVRHKLLDLLGDLTLLGGPLIGHVTAARTGHEGHVAFVRQLRRSLPLPGKRAGAPPDEWDISAIQDLLPHRYPFLLVDRITHLEEGKWIEGIKNVTINEPFFQGHFPGHPIMPAVLIIEAMAQVGGLLLLNSVDDPRENLMYFMGIDGARFRRPVTPGDQVRFRITLLRAKGGTAKMRGEAFVEGHRVAEAEILAKIVPRHPE